MKRLYDKIKESWQDYWKNDEYDTTKNHLSQNDKRSLWYGAFMMSVAILALSTLTTAISNIRVSNQNNKDMQEALNMIAAYMASATKDEYDDIAESIRHDLVFSEFGEDIENFIQYIPNTAENCRACMESYPAQAYLVCTNTGQLYELDLYDKGEEPDSAQSGMNLSFGYDEISQTSVHVTKIPSQKKGSAEIFRGRGIVSVYRMKSLFCDDCIREMLNTVKNQLVEEFVIFDTEQKIFYPIDSETQVRIGDYNLETEYVSGDYEIVVEYVVK